MMAFEAFVGALAADILVRPGAVTVERIVREDGRELYRVTVVPYTNFSVMRVQVPGLVRMPVSQMPVKVSGVTIIYPQKVYLDNILIDQSGYDPIEVCSMATCGVTLSPGGSVGLFIDDLSKIYIRNPSPDRIVVVEVVYHT